MAIARRSVTIFLAAALSLAGCGGEPPAPEGPVSEGQAQPEQVGLLTELRPGEAELVGEAVNQFGFDLFAELTDGTGNAVTSPLSASVLLAMVLAGAGGDTAAELAQALHLADPRDVRVGALQEAVTGTEEVTASAANGLWADGEVPFEADYLEFVQESLGATLATVDLGDQASATEIDDWVAEQTEGRIEELAADLGLPNPDAALVLVNTVYFLGQWSTQFDPADTVEQPFSLAGGGQVTVPMMHLREQEFGYSEQSGFQLLRLPYGEGGRYGMEVLLPTPDTGLPELLSGLDASAWRTAVDALTPHTIDELALPRFTLEWGASLNDPLRQLGVDAALDPGQADFSPMSPADLFLDQVVQKTFLQVDEAGTEAAAATGGSMGITSAQPALLFRVDRPFAFTISDTETGTILFLGAVDNPLG